LNPVRAARYDADSSRRGCLQGTRVNVFNQLMAWVLTPSDTISIYWLTGMAGTGKSSIAQSFCERIIEQHSDVIMTTFFASNSSKDRRDPVRMLLTLVYDAVAQCKELGEYVISAIDSPLGILDRPIKDLVKRLLAQPIQACGAITDRSPLIIVIDALDECINQDGLERGSLIQELASELQNQPVKVFVTSRMEASLKRMFDSLSKEMLKLHDIEDNTVAADVRSILINGFEEISCRHDIPSAWPSAGDIDELVNRTGHLMVFARTVLEYVGMRRGDPMIRLERVLSRKGNTNTESPFGNLDAIYLDILQLASCNDNNDFDPALCNRIVSLIGIICVAQEPLSVKAIASLLSTSELKMKGDVRSLASVLQWESGQDDSDLKAVKIFHPSFREFVTERRHNSSFSIDVLQYHGYIATRCLQVLDEYLHKNVCHIDNPSIPNSQVYRPTLEARIQIYVPDACRYACVHWLAHFQLAGAPTPTTLGQIHAFTMSHILHWIELLSILDRLPHAMTSLAHTLAWLRQTTSTKMSSGSKSQSLGWLRQAARKQMLYGSQPFAWLQQTASKMFGGTRYNLAAVRTESVEMLQDSLRALQMYDQVLKTHALHTYNSMLVTLPKCSLLRADHSYVPGLARLVTSRSKTWLPTRIVIRGHNDSVTSVAYSPDGTKVVSGSHDKNVRIWDAQSGRNIKVLKHHNQAVLSVAFSPDGTKIISGSNDKTVRIWDAKSGRKIALLIGHSSCVESVAFSPDGTRIASGSSDKTVRIWDAQSGRHIALLEGHSGQVTSVAFSPGSTKIVSGSVDETVRIWDAQSACDLALLKGHSSRVTSVAFSPDGTRIISGSDDKTVRIWDAQSGHETSLLKGHGSCVESVAFSPDGTRIASGSRDKTVRIWDAQSGRKIALLVLKDYSSCVESVVFSPDGTKIVLGSDDGTVRIWDSQPDRNIAVIEGHSSRVTSVAFSPDGTKIVSSSDDRTVRLWDAQSGRHIALLKGHSDLQRSVTFSPDSTKIVCDSGDKALQIWDAQSGRKIALLKGHSSYMEPVAFSPDSTRIASGLRDKTVQIWDAQSGRKIALLIGHRADVLSIAFSPDSTRIASGSNDETARIWDAQSGCDITRLEGHGSCVGSVAFSPDGTRIVSGTGDGAMFIWDVQSGRRIALLIGHSGPVLSVGFSPDGKQVIPRGEPKIWDVDGLFNLLPQSSQY
jgi:WD40 repeat protein